MHFSCDLKLMCSLIGSHNSRSGTNNMLPHARRHRCQASILLTPLDNSPQSPRAVHRTQFVRLSQISDSNAGPFIVCRPSE